MSEFSIEFHWCRDSRGYRLAWEYPATRQGYCAIMRNGGDLESLGSIEKKIEGLCFDFARLKAPEDLLEFVQRNGMLLAGNSYGPTMFTRDLEPLGRDLAPSGDTGPGDSVIWCLESARLFDELLRARSPARIAKFYQSQAADYFGDATTAQMEAVPDQHRGITFRIVTATLFGALWWHLTRVLRSGLDIKACRYCGCLFEAGPGARRRDAEFCREEHKIHYFSRRRGKGTGKPRNNRQRR
jgi:hypothetical protein